MNKTAVKKTARIATDVLMTADLTFLANRQNGTGLMLHAVLGIALFALFALHHVLNAAYVKSLFKGKYNAKRTVLAVTNGALCVAMIVMAISSVMISGLVFDFVFLPVNFAWRNVHAACSSWLFMLAAFHLSLHARSALSKVERKTPRVLFRSVLIIVFAAGVFAFSQSKIFSNLFLLYTDASVRYPFWAQIAFSVMTILGLCAAVHMASWRNRRV